MSKSLAVVNENQAKLLLVCDRLPKFELPPHFAQILVICQLNDLDMDMPPSTFPTIFIPSCLPSAGIQNLPLSTSALNLHSEGGYNRHAPTCQRKENSSGSAVLEAGMLLYMEPPPKLVFYPELDARKCLLDLNNPLNPFSPKSKLIKVNFFNKDVAECVNNFGLTIHSNFVDLDRVVKDILSIVYDQLPTITGDERVPPLALIRLARGRKTTTISKVFDNDAAELLRLMFLDRRGRYLVFTCHYPVSVETDTVMSSTFMGKSPSPRGLLTVDMPLIRTLSHLNELRNMSQKCLALTEERAAWLGYIPSLVFCSMNGTGITPSNRFRQSDIVVDRDQKLYVLKRFVDESLTGNRDPVVDQYYSAFQIVGKDYKLERHLNSKHHSGLEWECIVKVAIILQMLCAHWFGDGGPFNMVPSGIKPALAFHTLSEECVTVEEASRYMAHIVADYSIPTLIYVDSENETFPDTVGFLTKKESHQWRSCTNPSTSGRRETQRELKTGWTYLTPTEVRSFLGHSLLLAMPRDMLQE
eukprot:gene12210-25640_t